MTHRPAPIRVAAGTLVVAATVILTGCFANPLDTLVENVTEETTKNTAEEIIEGATGEDLDIEFGGLPDDFPEEVPLVSENVLQSVKVEDGMTLIVADSRSVKELAAQVKEDYAGWEEMSWGDLGEMVTGTFTKGESLSVTVGIIAGSEGEDTTVSYTVIPK